MRKKIICFFTVLIVLLMVTSALPVTGFEDSSETDFETEPEDVVAKRDLWSKTYDLGNEEYATDIYVSPIHYYDEDTGQYEDISTNIVTLNAYTYANTRNIIQTEFGAGTGIDGGVKLVNGVNDLSMEFRTARMAFDGVCSENIQDSEAVVSENEINYPEVFAGTTEQYIVKNGELKHNYILASPVNSPAGADNLQYVIKFYIDELELYIGDEKMEEDFSTFTDIEFRDSDGEIAFILGAGVAFDSADDMVHLFYDVKFDGDSLEIVLNVPMEWLNEAQYPVTVDPTIYLYPNYYGYAYRYYSYGRTYYYKYYSSYGYLRRMYYYSTYNYIYRAYWRWYTGSIPDAATINNLYFRTYEQYSYGGYFYYYLRHMNYDPYSAASTVWRDCGDGASYGYNYFTRNSYEYETLPSTARTDFKNKLGANWFAIGAHRSGDTSYWSGYKYEYGYFRMYGSYTYLRVTYSLGNRPPVADAGRPYYGNEGSSIQFDGSGSYDPDGDPITYRWNIAGSWTGWSASPYTSYTWGDDYFGTVTLEVRDAVFTDPDSTSVTVFNVAPTVNAGQDQTIFSGESVDFQGSFIDPGWLDTHTIEWDFDDTTTAQGTLTPTHTFYDPWVHNVVLKVTDDDNGVGQDIVDITVLPIPALVEFSPNALNLESMGNYVTVKVEGFPDDPWTTWDILGPTVTVEGVGAELKFGTYNDNRYIGKSDRLLLEDAIGTPSDQVELAIAGRIFNRIAFEGYTEIKAL